MKPTKEYDWDVNPSSYMIDAKGSFILKKDGTPKKKSGRPTKSMMSVSKKIKNIRKKEKQIQRLIDYVQVESLELPLKKRTTSTIPFGYKLNVQTNELEPIQSELDCLKEVEKEILSANFSLQDAVDFLQEKTNRRLSKPGLRKIMEKKYGSNCCSQFPKKNKGWIYALNSSRISGWVKFGQTVSPEKRLAQYNHTTPLRDYEILALCEVENKNKAEKKVLEIASFFSEEEKGEWKKIDKSLATKILKIYEDKYETH